MKKKLLFAMLCIAGALGLQAKEDVTSKYLTNANLSEKDNGWTYFADSFKYTDWKTDGDVPVVEFYSNWTESPEDIAQKDFKFSQTVTLPAGNYRLAVNAFYRNGGGDGTNENKAWIFAGEKKQNVVALTSAGVGGYQGSNDLYKAANAFSKGDFSNEFDFIVEGEDQAIEIGFQGFFNLSLSWCILGPVKLYEYTADDYREDLEKKCDEVMQAIEAYQGKVPGFALEEAKSKVESYIEANYESVADIQKAITEVNNIPATLAPIAAAYTLWVKVLNGATALCAVPNNSTDATAKLADVIDEQQDKVENTVEVAVIETATKALEAAVWEYVATATPTTGNKFDLTFLLTNPNLEGLPAWKGADGWFTDQTDGNSQVMENDAITNGQYKTCFEYWSASSAPKTDGYTLYLKTNLPNGVYSMEAQAFAQDQRTDDAKNANPANSGITFSANDVDGTIIDSDRLSPASISFYQQKTSDVKLGLRAHAGNTYNWMGIGYVTLYKVANDQAAGVYETVLASVKNTLADEKYSNVQGKERADLVALVDIETPEDYVAAIEALQTANSAFIAAKDAYDTFVKVANGEYKEELPYASAEKYAAIAKAQAFEPNTAEEATEGANAILSANRKYVESNALAEAVEGAEVIEITDACMEGGYDPENKNFGAWKIVGQTNGTIQLTDSESFTDGDGNNKYKYADIYKNDNNAGIQQTITLNPGKYMLTVTARAKAIDGAAFWVFAGDAKTDINRIGNSGGVFDRGWNDFSVEFTVTEQKDVNIGVQSGNGKDLWWSATRFRLVKLADVATLAVTEAQYATFVAPFAVEIPEGVTASTVTRNNGATLVLENLTGTIPAHTPVVLFSETPVTKTVEGVATEGTPKAGLLTGVYTETLAPEGSYVLQNQENVVAFYHVEEGQQPKVGANRAYLTYTGAIGVNAFRFGNDDATGIEAVEGNQKDKAVIYDLTGRRVEKAVNGLYIIDGKKVVIK